MWSGCCVEKTCFQQRLDLTQKRTQWRLFTQAGWDLSLKVLASLATQTQNVQTGIMNGVVRQETTEALALALILVLAVIHLNHAHSRQTVETVLSRGGLVPTMDMAREDGHVRDVVRDQGLETETETGRIGGRGNDHCLHIWQGKIKIQKIRVLHLGEKGKICIHRGETGIGTGTAGMDAAVVKGGEIVHMAMEQIKEMISLRGKWDHSGCFV